MAFLTMQMHQEMEARISSRTYLVLMKCDARSKAFRNFQVVFCKCVPFPR